MDNTDMYGLMFLVGAMCFLIGMVVMSWMLTREDRPPSIKHRCQHPFAVCPCSSRFFLGVRNIQLAPEICPNCGTARVAFGIQDYEFDRDVWFPVAVEPKVTDKCSKVKLLKSEHSKAVQSLNL